MISVYLSCSCDAEEHEIELESDGSGGYGLGDILPCGREVTEKDIEEIQVLYFEREDEYDNWRDE